MNDPKHWPYISIVALGTPLALIMPMLGPFLRWVRRGPLARITTIRGRRAKRGDFK